MHKVGRNDPCPCGSGKKFKKCCEEQTKHKKIQAQPISGTPGLSNLFKRHIVPIVPKPSPEPPPEEKNPVM